MNDSSCWFGALYAETRCRRCATTNAGSDERDWLDPHPNRRSAPGPLNGKT